MQKLVFLLFTALPLCRFTALCAVEFEVTDKLKVDGGVEISTSATAAPVISASSTTNAGNVGIGTTAPGAKLEVSGNVKVSSSAAFAGIGTVTSASGQGVLYFDSAQNVFKVSENSGVSKPIVDPPGLWTCTLRTGTATFATGSSSTRTATVSCSGNEKVMTGGCEVSSSGPNIFNNAPTGQGWSCTGSDGSGTGIVLTAKANCCQ